MELENIILSEVSQAQKAKATYSLSFAELICIRPNTNVAILCNTGGTKGRSRTKGVGN
jgi:hypothetical protein